MPDRRPEHRLCCLKFFVVLFISSGKYRDVARNWATVLNILHIGALKEYRIFSNLIRTLFTVSEGKKSDVD